MELRNDRDGDRERLDVVLTNVSEKSSSGSDSAWKQTGNNDSQC